MIWLSVLLFLQAAAPNQQIERGQTLFLADGGCGTCHALKGHGTAVGPDLKVLGRVGVRALVTAIRASRTEYVETVKLKGRPVPGHEGRFRGCRDGSVLRSFEETARVAQIRGGRGRIEVGQRHLEAPAFHRRLHQPADRRHRRIRPLGLDRRTQVCGPFGRGIDAPLTGACDDLVRCGCVAKLRTAAASFVYDSNTVMSLVICINSCNFFCRFSSLSWPPRLVTVAKLPTN